MQHLSMGVMLFCDPRREGHLRNTDDNTCLKNKWKSACGLFSCHVLFIYVFFLEVYQNTRTAKLLHLEKAPKERYKIVKMIWFCKLFPFSGFTPQTKLPASKNHQFSGFLNLESRNIDEISDIFHIASQDCFFVAAASVFYREKISV